MIMCENGPKKQLVTARPASVLDPAGSWAAQNAEAISERRALIEENGTPLADLQVLKLD
jgi:post-segregation antitoxin (ccd killing protein)